MFDKILEQAEKRLPIGLGSAVRTLLFETKLYFVHKKGVIQAHRFRGVNELKLQFGCGPNLKAGWVNIDLHKKADLKLDLRKPLPFAGGSCSLIYSEHFLEHLDYPEPVLSLLKECFRVLKPGGVFNVVVPDIGLVLRTYVQGGTEEYYAAQRRWNPHTYRFQMEHVNYNFRQDGEHRFAYDFETLKALLQRGGFVDVRRREFDARLDSKERLVGSLYAVCVKPAK